MLNKVHLHNTIFCALLSCNKPIHDMQMLGYFGHKRPNNLPNKYEVASFMDNQTKQVLQTV